MNFRNARLNSLLAFCLLGLGLSSACQIGLSASTPASTPVQRASASPSSETLSIFTDPLPEQIEIGYSWAGLIPNWPKDSYSLQYQSAVRNYQVSGTRKQVSTDDTEISSRSVSLSLDQARLQAVFSAAAQADWTLAREPAQEITHTDDYPSYSLGFKRRTQSVTLFSSSNTFDGTPWNLRVDQALYTSKDGTMGQALRELFSYLEAESQPKQAESAE